MTRSTRANVARVRGWGLALTLALGLPVVARATVEAQQARLPPPADACQDPVAGRWLAHVYYAHVTEWYRFTVDLHPSGDGAYTGEIHAHYWSGGPNDAEPRSCDRGGTQKSVRENAKASLRGLELSVDALDWRADTPNCGSSSRGYLLDHFAGTIDPELQEFQSLLNADAPEWRDVPTVFRRVRCAQPEARPPILEPDYVPAPAFQPSIGLSCWN